MIILPQFSPAIVLYDSRALNVMFYRRYSNTPENCVVPFDGDECLKKGIRSYVTQGFDFLKQGITLMRDVRDFFFHYVRMYRMLVPFQFHVCFHGLSSELTL